MAGELKPENVLELVDMFMSTRWEWDVADCCTSACNVFRKLHGIDLMYRVRGYKTAGGAARLIKSYGGFINMAESLARENGLKVGTGKTGEIGISSSGVAGGPEGRALLICVRPGEWAGKTEFGYAILPNAERCWRV